MKNKILIGLIVLIALCVGYFLIFNQNNTSIAHKETVIRQLEEYKKAKTEFESGNHEESFIILDKLLSEYPDQDWLRIEIADNYAEINYYDKALTYYFSIQSPSKLNIGERQIELRIGGIYEKLGNVDSAIYYYNKIIESETIIKEYMTYDNDKNTAFSRLGEIAFNQKNYADAINYFSQAIEIKRIPKDLYIRANAYFLTGNQDSAIIDYNESIEKIRKMYINKHPIYKDILCDSCGTFFGKDEYMDVLVEWRSLEEKIKDKKEFDKLLKSNYNYQVAIDSIAKWYREIRSLENNKDIESIKKLVSLNDSIKKYTDSTIRFNIYD